MLSNLNKLFNSTIVSDTNETTKKKKKRYYVPVYTLPRILKRDIRRDYGPMFANVLNSTNFSLMNNFFSTFVTRDCAFIETFYDSTTALQANSPVFNNTTVGQSEIANYLYTIISNFPDFMVKINSNQIIQKSGMVGSIIVFSTSMKGTKVDSLEMLPTSTSNTTTPLPLPIAIPNHVQGIFDDPSVPISEILHTNAWEKTLQQLLPDNPFSAATSLGDVSPPDLIMKDIGCESMLTFYLNEHNLIFKMEGRDQV